MKTAGPHYALDCKLPTIGFIDRYGSRNRLSTWLRAELYFSRTAPIQRVVSHYSVPSPKLTDTCGDVMGKPTHIGYTPRTTVGTTRVVEKVPVAEVVTFWTGSPAS